MRRKIFLLFVLLLLQTIFTVCPSFAEDVPVDLKADSLKYNEEKGIIEASGSVVIQIEGFTMHADNLIVDVNSNIITAEGNVLLDTGDYQAYSRSLTYDVSNEVAYLNSFHTVLTPSMLKGELFLKADKVIDRVSMLEGEEGDITTCDYKKPHYDTKAKKVEYYPDDMVVGHSVTFYINQVPVMWMPYFIYPLKKRRGKMPTTGQNEVEGYFIKTQWDYFMTTGAFGLFLLDYMEKKGVGYGFDHSYTLNDANDGRLYVYHVEERDTGYSDWVIRLDHQARLNSNTDLSFGHESSSIYLVPSGRRNRSINLFRLKHFSDRTLDIKGSSLDDRISQLEDYSLSFSHKQDRYATNYQYAFKRDKRSPHWVSFSHRIDHNQPLIWDSLNFSLSAPYSSYTTAEGLQANERFEPSITLTQNGVLPVLGGYSLQFSENWYIDPDQKLYTADDGDQYLEKQPEVNLSLSPYDLKLFNLASSFSYGYFHEVKYVPALRRNRDYATGKLGMGLVASKDIPVGLGSILKLQEGIEQYSYNPGDARYQLDEQVRLETQGFSFYRNNIFYHRRFAEGNTPFFFDQQSSFKSAIADSMTFYYLSKFVWNFSGGYNFLTKKYETARTDLTIAPDQRLKLTFKTGFDIENQKYVDLVSKIRIRPSNMLTGELKNNYDLNTGLIKTASSMFDIQLGDDNWRNRWQIKFSHSYDFFTRQYLLRDVMIIKDLHCWEAKYTYSDYRREHTLTFTLKALPDEPLGWSTGKGFFYQGFDRAFDRIKSDFYKDSPTRY
ncbi:MAG: hypothetical protein KKB81_05290 [Candidatus Margulisbacteria bacterium]|nr:hypothetical protein [Candidatus Margulisiibacteriota bacterium]MBU1021326.1 hypothetical protein [Candidatus Margulisiibacteriota bacterium]MBU1729185.1 hypothetical protein [Candidatus Margulisiibacteriota bacterium]MBU1954858.1 hypothetical protein [Candidatus Margulisiibacteriota bacterium]